MCELPGYEVELRAACAECRMRRDALSFAGRYRNEAERALQAAQEALARAQDRVDAAVEAKRVAMGRPAVVPERPGGTRQGD